MFKREAGVLLHISSLPGKEGCGTLGNESYKFIDLLSENQIKVWQVLPICPTGFLNSPYQGFSAFAGNPFFINCFDAASQYSYNKFPDYPETSSKASFDWCEGEKLNYLNEIFKVNLKTIENSVDFISFCKKESYWLDDFALFMAIKKSLNYISINNFPTKFKTRDKKALLEFKENNATEITFQKFLQFEFNRQWLKLKNYAKQKNVKIMGDLPIYVAYDSSDLWQNPELFSVDKSLNPIEVAGVPPDYFSETGQLWGNPVYNWDIHEVQRYKWWKQRISKTLELFDTFRIDHFRGFSEYWAIPAGDSTAVNGCWKKGPGSIFFNKVLNIESRKRIIAEDLGDINKEVIDLLNKFDFPRMKVLQFAFDNSSGNTHRPHYFNINSVVYTGTHDNDTLRGWINQLSEDDVNRISNYFGDNVVDIHNAIIRGAMASVSRLCIIPAQDILELDSCFRMNTPGTTEGNWEWRMEESQLNRDRFIKMKELILLYER